MRTYYIYKYTNLAIDEKTGQVSNKIYVGQCFNIDGRKKAHKSAALNGSTACPIFYNAIRHYGYEKFDFEIIETIYTDQKGIDDREIFWIKKLDARNLNVGMNLSIGGGGRGLDVNSDTHKKCPRCNEIKLRTEYTKDSSAHDGIRFCCQPCGLKIDREQRILMTEEELEDRRAERREKYAENPEKYIAEVSKYYEENKEEISKRKKVYRQEHSEEITAKNKENYAANKEERKEQAKQDRIKTKEENIKLGAQGICAKTPIKNCNTCKIDLPSTDFYIDLTASHGLSRNCKICHKAKMAKNREKARNN